MRGRNSVTMSNLFVKIWVDADSCPVQKEIVKVSKAYGISPEFIATINHFHTSVEGEEWTFLDHGSQSVDLFILNHVTTGDIVITQDLSLAVLLTSKGVYVITPRGKLISDEDASYIMDQKFIRQQTMKRKRKWKGPSAFKAKDKENFFNALNNLLSSLYRDR